MEVLFSPKNGHVGPVWTVTERAAVPKTFRRFNIFSLKNDRSDLGHYHGLLLPNMHIMGPKQRCGWIMSKSSVSFISMNAWIEMICLCVSWGYACLSLATRTRPVVLFVVERNVLKHAHYCEWANETFMRQVHHRAKTTLATGWGALMLVWNVTFRQGPVWACSESVSMTESNLKVICHSLKTCNVHSAIMWWSEKCFDFSMIWVIRANLVSM